MLPGKIAFSAAVGITLLGANAVLVSLGLASFPLLLSSLAMVAVEVVKVIFTVRRFRRAIDGNIMTPMMVAEGVSLLVDGLAVFLAIHADGSCAWVVPIILCADFLILRIAGWNALSHFFWK